MTPDELSRLQARVDRPFPWGWFALVCVLSVLPLIWTLWL